MTPAFAPNWLRTLWPLALGLTIGYVAKWVPQPYLGYLMILAFAIMLTLVLRMSFYMVQARVIVVNLHDLCAKLVEYHVPEAKKIDRRMSELTAEELLQAIAADLRRFGDRVVPGRELTAEEKAQVPDFTPS